jgi:hypothetical protein
MRETRQGFAKVLAKVSARVISLLLLSISLSISSLGHVYACTRVCVRKTPCKGPRLPRVRIDTPRSAPSRQSLFSNAGASKSPETERNA